MPKVSVVIEYLPKKAGQNITNYSVPQGNNISNPNQMSTAHSGDIPFLLGASPMGGGDIFWNTNQKYNGFISGVLTGSNGSANVSLTITGTAIDNFTITFDSEADQWAKTINVDGRDYENTGVAFTWVGASANSHTITIKLWNKPPYPVRITSILLGLTIEYDNTAVKELTMSSQSTSSNSEPIYGVLGQYGSITVIDYDREILDLARLGVLRAKIGIKIYLNKPNRSDYSTETAYQMALDSSMLGDISSEKWNYAYGNDKVKIELRDTILQWENKIFAGVQWQENTTALNVFNILNAQSDNVVTIDSALSNFLNSIKIAFVFIEKSSLLEAWNKLCNLAQLVIYKKTNGIVVALRYQ